MNLYFDRSRKVNNITRYIFFQHLTSKDQELVMSSFLVHYRIFALTPDMQPVQRDNETQLDASIVINIVVLYLHYKRRI